jgi:hypothetical protein
MYPAPKENEVRTLFNTWGYDTLFFEQTDSQTEVLLKSRVDGTHTVRRYDIVEDRWEAIDSDAWRS